MALQKLVKGSYNGDYGVEMCVDEGIYSISVFKYPEFTPATDALITVSSSDYHQASRTFDGIIENLKQVENRGNVYDTNRIAIYLSLMRSGKFSLS